MIAEFDYTFADSKKYMREISKKISQNSTAGSKSMSLLVAYC